jgi:hypothetical protein
MLEYLYGKRFGSKIAGANRKEGDRAVAGPRTDVGPCHHGMARPQVADGGTASNMEGRGEYIE